MGFSDYAEDVVGNLFLRATAPTVPDPIYLALFTADPGEDGAAGEVDGGLYARQAITFGAPVSGVFSNDADVTFTDMPDVVVTHWAIFDADTAGNMLYAGAWDVSKTYIAGEDAILNTGALDISHD